MGREADVWRTNRVMHPASAPIWPSQSSSAPVRSVKPWPRVATRMLWCAWLSTSSPYRLALSRLLARELGDAALIDRIDAFLEVGGSPQPRLFLQFDIGCRAHALGKPRAHGRPRLEYAQGRVLRNFGGEFLGGATHLGLCHQHIGKSDTVGFLTGDAPAGVKQHCRLGRSDQRRQGMRQTEARMKAKPREIGRKAGLRAGEAQIWDEGQAKTPDHSGTD